MAQAKNAQKYSLFTHHKKDEDKFSDSDYSYHYIEIAGHKAAVIIDNDKGRSVTNAIEDIADVLGVEHVVYRDTCGDWDYWGKDLGFKSLGRNGKPEKNMDIAIQTAETRIFGKTGLFAMICDDSFVPAPGRPKPC